MSFNSEVKEELTRVNPACSHCDKALLAALLRAEGTLFVGGGGDRHRLEIATDIGGVGRLTIRLIHELYGLKTELTMRRSVLHKTPNYLIMVPTQPGLKEVLVDVGILSAGGGLEMGVKEELVRKNCCAAAYLRGMFLGSGFVSNPRGDFHFEMTAESEDLAHDIIDLLAQREITAHITQRRASFVVYLKSGTAISEFLALTGAHQCALAMEDVRVMKSIRNEVNRKTNAEIANQAKSTNAAFDQLYAIRTVIDAYGLENIPPALQDFMRLRVAHPDATLKELGEFHQPKLSKSAIYHRVRRIEQMAREAQQGLIGQ